MYRLRRWTSRHAAGLEKLYSGVEAILLKCYPLLNRIGFAKLERPFMAAEKLIKGLLFDSKSCGSCTLSTTGMTCPMNCPKQMRNGPCGGVRNNGNCEVKPNMACVWVDAVSGSQLMADSIRILDIQAPTNHQYQGTSAWLRLLKQNLNRDHI